MHIVGLALLFACAQAIISDGPIHVTNVVKTNEPRAGRLVFVNSTMQPGEACQAEAESLFDRHRNIAMNKHDFTLCGQCIRVLTVQDSTANLNYTRGYTATRECRDCKPGDLVYQRPFARNLTQFKTPWNITWRYAVCG